MNAGKFEEPSRQQLLARIEGYMTRETEKSQNELREGKNEQSKRLTPKTKLPVNRD